MIKANHKQFWVKASVVYSNFFLKLFFRNLRFISDYQHSELPVLMIANHFSWWDGFIQILIHNKFIKRKFHFMMLERELRKSMILTTIGAFSVNKGKRSNLESVQYASEILKEQENMLLFFPQGKIESIYTDYFKFEKGLISHLVKDHKNEFQFVFNVNLIDYSANRKPELSCYFKAYKLGESNSIEDIEKSFNEYAKECKLNQRV